MLEFIITTLAEIGLLREDFKHQKRIRAKEKQDGVKRPFQKYALQPSVLLFLCCFVLVVASSQLFFTYQRKFVFPKKTKKEIAEMSARAESYKSHFGKYPATINELIANSPMRQSWKTDAWDRPYQYIVTNNGNKFIIISAGPDGKFNTNDDIASK
ncbi:type II secretion system protein GspG [Tamlana sp. 62-3]|uniref:Type II secretion system protein GspG n=1 Tax=Neotamlana sargassicola TaxID=2883125 RepID=A0A9X1I4S7_9FLAO|nr:type II secretion system protein GspG [Tamlana sargassicola]MCB4806830.1 type II secretion system protein GspG [Tamlana sargassicola]